MTNKLQGVYPAIACSIVGCSRGLFIKVPGCRMPLFGFPDCSGVGVTMDANWLKIYIFRKIFITSLWIH